MSFTGIGNQNNRNKNVLPLRKVAQYSSWLSYPSIGCSPAVPTSVSLNLTNVLFFKLTQFSEQTLVWEINLIIFALLLSLFNKLCQKQ
jgi:hypothetical protein